MVREHTIPVPIRFIKIPFSFFSAKGKFASHFKCEACPKGKYNVHLGKSFCAKCLHCPEGLRKDCGGALLRRSVLPCLLPNVYSRLIRKLGGLLCTLPLWAIQKAYKFTLLHSMRYVAVYLWTHVISVVRFMWKGEIQAKLPCSHSWEMCGLSTRKVSSFQSKSFPIAQLRALSKRVCSAWRWPWILFYLSFRQVSRGNKTIRRVAMQNMCCWSNDISRLENMCKASAHCSTYNSPNKIPNDDTRYSCSYSCSEDWQHRCSDSVPNDGGKVISNGCSSTTDTWTNKAPNSCWRTRQNCRKHWERELCNRNAPVCKLGICTGFFKNDNRAEFCLGSRQHFEGTHRGLNLLWASMILALILGRPERNKCERGSRNWSQYNGWFWGKQIYRTIS